MSLNEIYERYTPACEGFCIAVSDHCGYEMSRTEIKRVALIAETAEEFDYIWENEDWWPDG